MSQQPEKRRSRPDEPPRPEDGGVSDVELFRKLHQLKRLIDRSRVGRDHAQARILALINGQGSMDQRELLRLYPVKPATMSQLLLKLERQGLITRPRLENDQRRRNVELTPAGRAEAQTRASGYRSGLDRFFRYLTVEERRSFMAILVKLTNIYAEHLKAGGLDLAPERPPSPKSPPLPRSPKSS